MCRFLVLTSNLLSHQIAIKSCVPVHTSHPAIGAFLLSFDVLYSGRETFCQRLYKTFFFSAPASSRKIYSLSLRSVSRPVSRRKGVLIFDAACIEPNINFGRRRFFAAKNKSGGRARRTPRSSQKKRDGGADIRFLNNLTACVLLEGEGKACISQYRNGQMDAQVVKYECQFRLRPSIHIRRRARAPSA
jgi:hypothetical protein